MNDLDINRKMRKPTVLTTVAIKDLDVLLKLNATCLRHVVLHTMIC